MWGQRCPAFRWELAILSMVLWPIWLLYELMYGDPAAKVIARLDETTKNIIQLTPDEVLLEAVRKATQNSAHELEEADRESHKSKGKGKDKEKHDKTLKDKDKDKTLEVPVHDYVFAFFNAWLYSGSDNQWAGSLKLIHEEIDKHYGPDYAHAKRRAQLIMLAGQTTVAAIVFLASTWILVMTEAVDSEDDDLTDESLSTLGSNGRLLGGGILAILSLFSVGSSTFSYVTTPATSAQRLAKDASKPSFKDKLGYGHHSHTVQTVDDA